MSRYSIAALVLASWYALLTLPTLLRISRELATEGAIALSDSLHRLHPRYDPRVASSIIEYRRGVNVEIFLSGVEFQAPESRAFAAEVLGGKGDARDPDNPRRQVPQADEVLIGKLARAYQVAEVQELELASAHIRSVGTLQESEARGLARTLFLFKPHYGIRHRHEIRFIVQWWLEVEAQHAISRRERREVARIARSFHPVKSSYSAALDAIALPTHVSGDPAAEPGPEEFTNAPALDLLEVGSDPDTPVAAIKVVGGLENLFHRLGMPPSGSALEPAGSSSGGGGAWQ